MYISTALPLGALYFKHWHVDDTEVGVCVAKASFRVLSDGSLKTIRPAPDIQLEDEFDGDPARSTLAREQEFAPGKTGTDILIRATAHSPGGAALQDWPVSVEVPGRLHYGFQVRGPSMWRPAGSGWALTAPEPVTEVPLSYALAFGGETAGEAPEVFDQNPAGRGFSTEESRRRREPFAAPQIGELSEFVTADVDHVMAVHGVSPVAKAWVPRRGLAGTFDKDWELTRHPRMPLDYDLGFWNCAHPRLQVRPYLNGDETIVLSNMAVGGGERSICLPGIRMTLAAKGAGVAKAHSMTLDTVDIDVADPDPKQHRLNLVWRCRVTGPDRFSSGELHSAKLE